MPFSTNQNFFSRVDSLTQLEKHSNELAAAVKNLANYSRRLDAEHDLLQPPAANLEAHQEIQHAVASILSNTTRIRSLVCGPTDFLKHLASQVCSYSTQFPHHGVNPLRMNSSRACDGWASSRFWPASQHREACQP